MPDGPEIVTLQRQKGTKGGSVADQTERGTLNHLIETCKDAERGFRYAANHVSDANVKAMFLEIAAQSEQFAADLLPYAQRLGGAADHDGSVSGALHRGWMTLKDAMRHDEAAVIREAERGERVALGAYTAALEGVLPPTVVEVVERQRNAIKGSHARIESTLASQAE